MANEREKLSFSERDKRQREGKYKGRDNGGGHGKRVEHTQAYSSYKQQLNKLFDGTGQLPEALQDKLAQSGVGKSQAERKASVRSIGEAKNLAEKLKALADFRRAYDNAMPEDEEVLQGFLQVSEELDEDPDLICDVIATLDDMHSAGTLKRLSTLKARLKNTRMMVDDDDVDAAAMVLLKKL